MRSHRDQWFRSQGVPDADGFPFGFCIVSMKHMFRVCRCASYKTNIWQSYRRRFTKSVVNRVFVSGDGNRDRDGDGDGALRPTTSATRPFQVGSSGPLGSCDTAMDSRRVLTMSLIRARPFPVSFLAISANPFDLVCPI